MEVTQPLVSRRTVARCPKLAKPHATCRRHDRILMTTPVTLLAKSEGHTVPCPSHLVDVTEQGARIKAGVALNPREVVIIIPREGPAYAVNSRVIWAAEGGSDVESEMGFEFQNPMPTMCWG